MRPAPSILILAAGASSRMRGADKLLEEIDGTPLILRAVRAACAVASEVIVALPPDGDRRAWLGDSPARLLTVHDRAMSASVRAGVAACTGPALLIHLADMPEIGAPAFEAMSRAWQASDAPVLRAATPDERPGQPVIFDRALFGELSALTGDMGARDVVAGHEAATAILPGQAALTDLDTPEDWAAWRGARA